MILKNEFAVEAPVERAWSLLDDVENVIVCMPGAAYVGRDGDDHKVSIKVKVGAITVNFQGTVQFIEKNEAERSARIKGVGKDLGGKASATAIIGVKFDAVTADRTRVLVDTDLAMTGRLAQFGGGIMADIASRMIEEFSQNLHAAVLARSPESASAASARPEGTPATSSTAAGGSTAARETAAFDLGPVLAKQGLQLAAMVGAGVAAVWLIVKSLRKRR